MNCTGKLLRLFLCVAAVLAVAVGGVVAAGAEKKPPADGPDDTQGKPFKIAVDDAVPQDPKKRLARTRCPDQIDGARCDYGVELKYMKELITYSHDKYDWRAQEKKLNQFDQYVTTPDALKI